LFVFNSLDAYFALLNPTTPYSLMTTLLLTFANSEHNRLSALTQECEEVNEALQERFADGDFVVISEPLATRYKIIDLIRAHEENICLFLFSGHAGRDRLVLEDGAGHVDGIADLLGRCPKLELVILNGCSTAGQVKVLLENGIPVVIATDTAVSDEAATQFSIAFFKELAQERKSIREAFVRAIEAAGVFGNIEEEVRSTRGLGLDNEDKPLWGLYYNEAQKERLDTWRLPAPEPVTSVMQTGRIVHNIPAKMKKDSRILCKVRIAKDDEKLLKNFKLPDERTPETLEISKTMEVELVDAGGDVFRIEWILPGKANAEQPIVGHTFTEWIFAVTPLREGDHTLLLCAYFIEKIDGEKTKRTLSFERHVTITAEMDAKMALPQWQLTYITTQGNAEKKKKAGVVGWATSFAKPLIAAAVLLLSTLFVLNTFNNNSEVSYSASAVDSTAMVVLAPNEIEWVAPVLLLNDSLAVDSVFVNGYYLTDWTANADTTELYLTEQPADTLRVLVRGKNGECYKSAYVSGANPTIQLDCIIRLRMPVFHRVGITVPVDATLNIDGEKKFDPRREKQNNTAVVPIRPLRATNHTLFYNLKEGYHTFSVSGLNGYRCPDSRKRIRIERDTILDFKCTTVQHKVTLKTPFKPVAILVDGKVIDPAPSIDKTRFQDVRSGISKQKNDKIFVTSFNVDRGVHLIQIITPQAYYCTENPQKINVQSDKNIDLGCSYVIQ
jgi:CHAT domain